MFYIYLIIFYLLFIWLANRNICWGIYLSLFFLPAYQIRYQVFGIPGTLLEGMIWLLFIIWLLKLKKEKNLTFNPIKIIKNIINSQSSNLNPQNPILKNFRLPIILFLIAATISTFISPELTKALGIWRAYFVEALLFFIVFVYNIKTLEQAKNIIRILGGLTIAIGLFAIYQKLTGALIPEPLWSAIATRRVTTFFSYPNAGALLIAPIILLTIGNLLTDFKSGIGNRESGIVNFKSWVSQFFNLLVIMLGSLTILWTKSAGALIAVVAGIACLLIFNKKTRLITLFVILFLIASSTSLIKNPIEQTYISVSEIHLSVQPTDMQLRTQQWRETVELLKDKPIFGSGLNGYQTLIKPYHINKHIEIFLYPHNFFLNFWTETGLLGLVSMLWILIVFFLTSFKFSILSHQSSIQTKLKTEDYNHNFTLRILTLTAVCAIITLLIHGLVDVPYFKNDLSIMFWMIVGIMIVLTNSKS